jgi:hypothetical protein
MLCLDYISYLVLMLVSVAVRVAGGDEKGTQCLGV